MAVKYLSPQLIKIIHSDQIRRYGGRQGIRDSGLLESALAQPKMTANRKEIYKTIFEKAAAYGFHLCRNHPFVDGNKRVAFVAMYFFLHKNGWNLEMSEEAAYIMIMDLAGGKLTKPGLVSLLKENSRRIS